MCANRQSGKKKQHKHKLFGPDFPRTFLTLTPGRPWVKKFLPITGAAENTHFLVRTSTIFGADVHDLCTKKVCVDFLAPRQGFAVQQAHSCMSHFSRRHLPFWLQVWLPSTTGSRAVNLYHRVLQGRPRHRRQLCSTLPGFPDPSSIRKVWVSIKFLSAKFGFTPPPRKGPK